MSLLVGAQGVELLLPEGQLLVHVAPVSRSPFWVRCLTGLGLSPTAVPRYERGVLPAAEPGGHAGWYPPDAGNFLLFGRRYDMQDSEHQLAKGLDDAA
jgi:hypothetical protein